MRRYHSLASRRIRNRRKKVAKNFGWIPGELRWGFDKEQFFLRSGGPWSERTRKRKKASDKKKIDSLQYQLIELNNKEWLDERDEEYYWSNFWPE